MVDEPWMPIVLETNADVRRAMAEVDLLLRRRERTPTELERLAFLKTLLVDVADLMKGPRQGNAADSNERRDEAKAEGVASASDDRILNPIPEGDHVVLWRYLDFARFVALLESKALYFSRIATFADPFEGSFPLTQPPERRYRFAKVDDPDARARFVRSFVRVTRSLRRWSLASCWHANADESMAMWRMYSGKGSGVAIRSTVGRLRNALRAGGSSDGRKASFYMVEYIDYRHDEIPSTLVSPLLRKWKSFEHEREMRAIVAEMGWDEPPDRGRLVPVDVQLLIDAIFIAPQAEPWYRDLVRAVARRYGLGIEPCQSALDMPPIY